MSYYVVQTLLLLVLAYFLGTWIGCTFRSWFSYRRFERAYWKNPEAYAAAGTGSLIEDQVLEFVESAEVVPEAEIPDELSEPVRRSAIAEEQNRLQQKERIELAPQEIAEPEINDLRRIEGVEEPDIVVLEKHNVRNFEQIVRWNADDVRHFNALLGNGSARIQRQNWIEQAAILANGQKTSFADRFDAQASYVVSEPLAEEARPQFGEPSDEPEDYQVQEQISQVADAEVIQDVVDDQLQQPEQTQEPDPNDRQIIDETVHQESLEQEDVPAHADIPEQGEISDPAKEHALPPDNLKRIGGIGVIIERRLNALGIYRYDQIAAWTDADVERVDAELDFPGRIEREEWREQAQILAEGGTTDFASRFDRGDVGPEDE